MAQLTFAYPDAYRVPMVAALRRLLGADGEGLTPTALFQEVVKRTMMTHLRAVILSASTDLVAASDTLATAQATAEAAGVARRATEQGIVLAVNTAFGAT